MRYKARKPRSIMKKIMLPMIFVLLLQTALFWGAIFFQGTIKELNNNSFELLNQKVINRKNYIEGNLLRRLAGVNSSVQTVNTTVNGFLEENEISSFDLKNSSLSTDLLESLSDNLITLLRKYAATGIFIILNGSDDPYQTFGVSKTGLYIRNPDPFSCSKDNSDLLLERSPSALAQALNIPMDSSWNPTFQFDSVLSEASYSYYYKPLRIALEMPGLDYLNYGYWSKPFQLNPRENNVITYSVPLLLNDGTPYGVLGIEISTDFLKRNMPYDEITKDQSGSYMIAMSQDQPNTYEKLITSGPLAIRYFNNQETLKVNPLKHESNIYTFVGNALSQSKLSCSIQNFKLYDDHSPFQNDQWVLIGTAEDSRLLGFSKNVIASLGLATMIAFAIGLSITIIIGKLLADPVILLVKKVKNSNPHIPVQFDRTNITEIDELASALELLNRDVAESASKLSRIIEMISLPLAAFEYELDKNKAYYTKGYFKLFGIEDHYSENGYIELNLFQRQMDALKPYIESYDPQNDATIYRISVTAYDTRWIHLITRSDNKSVFGIAEDITHEVLEKKKIEHDRDYDFLTGLLNRRAFISQLTTIFNGETDLKIAAMLMLDLDNLKYINDTYGHDCGDQYINCVAKTMHKNVPSNTLLSRMSGDEFYLFLYGYDSQQEIRDIILEFKETINNTIFPLDNEPEFRIRASFGVAWYPQDALSFELLIRYADFAMYIAKNTAKGELKQFNLDEYDKNSYLFHKKEEFNKLIDQDLFNYHFQPIVNAGTGELFAYEALMRSSLDTLDSPLEILTLAKTQSKLYQIERSTLFLALKDFSKQKVPEDCRIFINSIANQILSNDDIAKLEQEYQPYLSRIVIELTEEEKQNDSCTVTKQQTTKIWNAQIALDDFGSGYNSELALLYLSPDYVKVDMSIVRNIDTDENRLKILQNLISYTKERGILVIAEGVETRQEMETLIRNGVDLLQGYYIGKPAAVAQAPNPQAIQAIKEIIKGTA